MEVEKKGYTTLSGPMFESSQGSIFGKDGAHYNIYSNEKDVDSFEMIKNIFGPSYEANEYNICLFSTSGIHGLYTTIEQIEDSALKYGWDYEQSEDDDDYKDDFEGYQLTFLIIHPRIVCMRYGNVRVTKENIEHLKTLRQSSLKAVTELLTPIAG